MPHYKISPVNPNSHVFNIELTFETVSENNYAFSLPAWLPGSYLIRDFAKNIINLSARNSTGKPIAITKVDKQTWQLIASDSQITLYYDVFAFDLSVRTAYLDLQRGFFNGSSTFLQIHELADTPCTLEISPPEHTNEWQVASGLKRDNTTEKYGFGLYHATNYQELIDCPVAIGVFDSFEFKVNGVTHHFVFTSEHFGDNIRLAKDLTKICQHHIALFEDVPFDEYWFITHLLEDGFGGLEHKNSTVLLASRFDLPNPNQPNIVSDKYQNFLSLCSHEYFHAWNVCRIKPIEFVPYDLQQENYTEQLWAYEGITSYYDDFSLYRSELINFETYLSTLAKTVTRVFTGTGELKQSVAESSFYAWTKFYQQGADAINNIVSYYTKGSLIALWLDLTIRDKSSGKYSLDHLMRAIWQQFGKTGKGTTEQDFIDIACQLSGEDISEAFRHILHNTERVPLSPLLEKFGINFLSMKCKTLNGFEAAASSEYSPYIGAKYKAQSIGVKIIQVLENSPAAKAGLAVNDVLIAINQLKISEQSLQQLAQHLPEGSTTQCVYFRDDQLMQGQLTFIDSPTIAIGLSINDQQLTNAWCKVI